MTGTRVATERHDTALVLTLAGPDRLNAVTPTAMEALHTALGEAGRDPAIRAVILTGRGRAFCAGADLRDDLDPEATMRAANRVVETIRAVDVPVIAAVNGPAVGYGAALAAAADLAVAADDAYLLLPFTGVIAFLDYATVRRGVGGAAPVARAVERTDRRVDCGVECRRRGLRCLAGGHHRIAAPHAQLRDGRNHQRPCSSSIDAAAAASLAAAEPLNLCM